EALPALRLLFSDTDRLASLESALEASSVEEQIEFRSALAAYGVPEAEPELIAIARSPHAILRRGAVEALGDLGSPAARDVLRQLATSPDAATAAEAMRALERAGAPSEIDALLAEAADSKQPAERRTEAVRQLAARGDRRASATLVRMLADDDLRDDA